MNETKNELSLEDKINIAKNQSPKNSNSFGLIFYLIGLTDEEKYVKPQEVEKYIKQLEPTNRIEDDSIIIYFNNEAKEYWHGIYVKEFSKQNMEIIHREFATVKNTPQLKSNFAKFNTEVQTTSFIDYRIAKYHFNEKFDKIYLKRKN